MSEGLKYFTGTDLTIMAFFLFFAIFVSALYIVFRPNRRSYMEKMEQLPLQD